MEKKNKSANNKLIGGGEGRGGQRSYDLYKHRANEQINGIILDLTLFLMKDNEIKLQQSSLG